MGKMIESPRNKVLSFRVTDDEHDEILAAKESGHKGTFIRKMVKAGLQVPKQSKENA